MYFSQYFCNLYQAYLMATNSFKFSYITSDKYIKNVKYNEPGGHQLSFYFNEGLKTTIIHINTNYEKSYPYSRQDKYYHASEIEALIIKEGFKNPFFSLVKEGVDKKTFKDILLITRRVLL